MQTSDSIKDDLFSTTVFFKKISISPPPPRHVSYPTEGNGILRGEGFKKRQFPRWWGVAYRVFSFSGGLGEIGKLFINNSFSVEQAISYFTVIYGCFKTSIIVCIDHLLTTVG